MIDVEPGDEEQTGKRGVTAKGKGRAAKDRNLGGKAISEAKPWELFHHVVMNLPASALEFLGEISLNQCLARPCDWSGSLL